jgi:ADP-ribose pyrophosphatase YjhB (NUDIX family)
MGIPKLGRSTDGREMHYSVGALIERNGKYLLIDRVKPPLGFAGIAGHIDGDESKEHALFREVKEESNLNVIKNKLIFEEELNWNKCSKGIGVHYWYLFDCKASGRVRRNPAEAKSIGWYSIAEISKLNLEPVWAYWFEKLKKNNP